MSKEIKFRAFQDGQMLVSPISSNYGLARFFGLLYEDAPIMQFTGLHDKSGKEIYEGDIIKMGDNPECWFSPRVVEFINGSWMGRSCRIYTNQDKRDYQGDSNQNNWEIIGNIYENPELLSECS